MAQALTSRKGKPPRTTFSRERGSHRGVQAESDGAMSTAVAKRPAETYRQTALDPVRGIEHPNRGRSYEGQLSMRADGSRRHLCHDKYLAAVRVGGANVAPKSPTEPFQG